MRTWRHAFSVAALLLTAGGCSWNWTDRASANDGGGDTGVDSGPGDSCAAHADALFCDGFESGDFSRWKNDGAGNPLTIATMAHTGTYAALGETSGVGDQARFEANWATPVTSGSIFARAYFFVPTGTVTEQSTLFSMHGKNGNRIAIVLSTKEDTPGTTFISNDLPNGGGGAYSTPEAMALGKWECMELEVRVAAAPDGYITLSRNGKAFGSGNRTGINTDVPGGYAGLRLPASYSAQEAPFAAYVDDVIVDTKRIGCD